MNILMATIIVIVCLWVISCAAAIVIWVRYPTVMFKIGEFFGRLVGRRM